MFDDEAEPIRVFKEFLVAFDRWESGMISCDRTGISAEAFIDMATKLFRSALAPFCTRNCLDRVGRVSAFSSPSEYGPDGDRIVDFSSSGETARVVTQGSNNFPTSRDRQAYLFVREDGQWKIDSKKELSENGRERKVDLF